MIVKSIRRLRGGLAVVALVATAALAAGQQNGIPARQNAAAYSVHGEIDGVAVGARLLTAKEVKAAFVTEVSRCCLVVEVGLFPQAGKSVKTEKKDFTLSSQSAHIAVAPEDPKVAAYAVKKAKAAQNEVSVYPTAGIGYGTGGVDPWGYPTPGSGVYTSVGVGVGVGKAGEPSSADTKTMQLELTEKSLPEGDVTKPVAGYLYFRVPADKGPYEFQYRLGGKTITLHLH